MPDDDKPTVPPIQTPEGPATTSEWRAEYENIGPYYKGLALICAVGAFGLLIAQRLDKHPIGWPDVAVFGIIVVLVIALIRPKKFDGLIKTVADKLPGKYSKPKDE